MRISWIKYSKDNKSFKVFKSLGMDVFDVEDLDLTDKKIEELIDKKYKTIIISNELAFFSQDIINKYNKNDDINIIIAPPKKNKYNNLT